MIRMDADYAKVIEVVCIKLILYMHVKSNIIIQKKIIAARILNMFKKN